MNTTMSEQPEGGMPSETTRRQPVIAAETTTEIPVHLLFRDDNGPLLRPSVVARRQGTGEQPKVTGRTLPPRPPTAPVRPTPPCDPDLLERPGPALSGWTALVAGSCSVAGIGAVLWGTGAVPVPVAALFGLTPPHPFHGIGFGLCALLALGVLLALFAFGGLARGRVGHAWVLTLCGDYQGSVRRTGLVWVSPLVLRRRIDVRLRHWRSEPIAAVDGQGTALRVAVLVVWRVTDTARATLGVENHEQYLGEQVEASLTRVLSHLPPEGTVSTLRNADAFGDALTRMLAAECAPVGLEVFSAQPTSIEYEPEVAAALQRERIAAIDAQHRDTVLTSVVDAVDDTVGRLTQRGLVELDDYERKALVKDLTVAFYTGRAGAVEAP
ncbi:SPFH domain-containing protein [Streptomyces sp. NPDC006208]|uniref:SPFH domain-containing protein n=1 Tax=Streptomyces sp. NPDC006208 TaxID=3156734 RepID=UPI0033A0383A